MADLRTNYKDDILSTAEEGTRKFNIVDANGNALYEGVHLEDVSNYLQVGDEYGADEINEQNEAINNHTNIIGDTDISDIGDGTATGAISKLNGIVSKANRHTGTYLAEVGTHEGSALAKRIYGMSVQDGTPTPDSPVDIVSAKADFKCVGKNLIPYPYLYQKERGNPTLLNGVTWTVNADGTISAVGTASNNSNYYLMDWKDEILFHAGETYTLTGCPSGGSGTTYSIMLFGFLPDQSGSELTPTFHKFDTGNGVTFTIPQDCYIRIYCRVTNGTTAPTDAFKPMLTLADADQTYEVNQHKDVTTDLTLRSIEVASTDDYTYERDGKYYIADTIDWSEDRGYEITRRIKEITIDENNTSDWYEASTAVYDQITYSLDTITSNVTLMCNQMPNVASWTPNNCFVRSSNHLAHFLFDANKFGSKENAIAYFTNNPLVFTYVKDTPTTESITSEQAQALLSLKTYDEATSITATSDIEPTIDLEYATSEMSAKALTGHNEGYIAQELESVYGVKNLIPYPYYETTKTINGLTFTVNDDGSITVNGTSTQETPLILVSSNQQSYIEPGTYKVTLPEGTQKQFLRVYDYTNGGRLWDYNSTGDMVVSQRCLLGANLIIRGNETLDNKVFHPMLRPASIQSNEYQPYAMSNYELTKKIKELETALTELTSQ